MRLCPLWRHCNENQDQGIDSISHKHEKTYFEKMLMGVCGPDFRNHTLGYGDLGPNHTYPYLRKIGRNRTLDDGKCHQNKFKIRSLAKELCSKIDQWLQKLCTKSDPCRRRTPVRSMMTSSNGNIFRVTGPFCGKFTGHRWIPPQRPVTRSFDVFFHLRLNKRLSKQSWGWWFETRSRSLWRHC